MREKLTGMKRRWSKRATIITASVVVVLGVATTLFVRAQSEPVRSSQPTTSLSTKKPTSEPSVAPKTDQQPVTDADTTTPVVAKPTNNTTVKPATNAPAKTTSKTGVKPVEFNVTPSSFTMQSGTNSPRITATSTNGQPLAWVQSVGFEFQTVDGGIFKTPELSHSYVFRANPAIKPGVYTIYIMGYLPKGQEVKKPITITVTQGPTFSLAAMTPDYQMDTEDTFYVPFKVDSLLGTPTNVKTTATIVNSNGVPMSIGGIQDVLGSYGYRRNVIIYDGGYANGRIVIRITASDGINTSTLDIPYDVLTEE